MLPVSGKGRQPNDDGFPTTGHSASLVPPWKAIAPPVAEITTNTSVARSLKPLLTLRSASRTPLTPMADSSIEIEGVTVPSARA